MQEQTDKQKTKKPQVVFPPPEDVFCEYCGFTRVYRVGTLCPACDYELNEQASTRRSVNDKW